MREMRSASKKIVCILLVFLLTLQPLLGRPGMLRAEPPTPPVPLSSLAAGGTVSFAGYAWIVLNPATGYLLMQPAFGAGQKFESAGFSPFDPNRATNIGYYLNNAFLNSLGTQEQAMIENHTWTTGGQVNESETTAGCKISLIAYSEYVAYEGIISDLDVSWWLRTHYTGNNGCWVVRPDPDPDTNATLNGTFAGAEHAVRPAIYLDPSALVLGGEVLVGEAGVISDVALRPNDHDVGSAQDVMVTVSTGNVPDGTPVTVTFLDGDQQALDPAVAATGTISSDAASLTLHLPQALASGPYCIETAVDGVAGKEYTPYTVNHPAPTALLSPGSHTAGTMQTVTVDITAAAGVSDGVTVFAAFVDSNKAVVNGAAAPSGELSGGVVSLSMFLPQTLPAGSYFVRLTGQGMATAYIPYTILSAEGIGVSLNPAHSPVNNVQDVTVTVTTSGVDDGTLATACLQDSNFGDLVPALAVSGTVADNSATLTLSLPDTLPAGLYHLKVTVDGIAMPVYAIYTIDDLATYTVSLSTDPAGAGTVSGAGTFAVGESVTVTAQPRPGYRFVSWASGGERVSTSATYTFIGLAAVDLDLVANFSLIPPPEPDPEPVVTAPTVSTARPTEISTNSATLRGSITHAGGAPCTEVQFRYRAVGDKGWQETAVESGSWDSGFSFSAQISGLRSNATYEYQALAGNSKGWGEGSTVRFELQPVAPQVSTQDASDVTPSGARLHGCIADFAEAAVRECGFSWTSPDGETKQVKATPSADGGFAYDLSGLTTGHYSFSAYAVNKGGSSTGGVVPFFIPTMQVTTLEADEVSFQTAVIHGNLLTGTRHVWERGFVYGKTEEEAEQFTRVKVDGLVVDGDFSAALTDLEVGTDYSFSAYAIGADGEKTGETLTFRTLDYRPVVETRPAEDIKPGAAGLNGYIHFNRGYAVLDCGFLWGTSAEPSEQVQLGLPADGRSFSLPLSELLPATTYYYRAYATNIKGTGYGEVCEFNTPASVPVVVTTSLIFNPDAKGALSFQGELVQNGGSVLTEYGFRYSTDEQHWQTLITGVEESPQFSTRDLYSLTSLEPSTDYCVQAYAANEVGFGYGESLALTTPDRPTVVVEVDSAGVGSTEANLVGRVLDSGSPAVLCTEYQFQYRLQGETDWIQSGWYTHDFADQSFSLRLQDLKPGSSYEVLAEATNSTGATGVSEVVVFSTTWGDTSDEAALNLREHGYRPGDIADHIRTNYAESSVNALRAIYFAGFDALEAAQALRHSSYQETAGMIIQAFCEAGLPLDQVAGIASRLYYPQDNWRNWWRRGDLLAAAIGGGYGIEGVLRWMHAQKEQLSTVLPVLEESLHKAELYDAVGKVYGADELMGYLQDDDPLLITTLHGLGLDATEIVQAWSRKHWALSSWGEYYLPQMAQWLAQPGTFGAWEIGEALYAVYQPQLETLYRVMKGLYPESDVLNLLANDLRFDLSEVARLLTKLRPPEEAQLVLEQLIDLYQPDAYTLTKAFYSAGWDQTGTGGSRPGLDMIVLHLFYREQITDPAELIEFLTSCSVDPLHVAQAVQAARELFVGAHISADKWSLTWLPIYVQQGHSASDIAVWSCRDAVANGQPATVFATVSLLSQLAFSETDIVRAVRHAHGFSKGEAIQQFAGEGGKFQGWWDQTRMLQAIEEVYGPGDPIPEILRSMVGPTVPPTNPYLHKLAAGYLRRHYLVTDPVRAAVYLHAAGFSKYQVQTGITDAYLRGADRTNDLRVLCAIDREVYGQSGQLNRSLLDAYCYDFTYLVPYNACPDWYVSGLMLSSGYSLDDVVQMLKQPEPEGYGLSLDETLAILTAGEEILSPCFSLTMSGLGNPELVASLSRAWDVNVAGLIMQKLRDRGYSPGHAISWLGRVLQDMHSAAVSMQAAGYSDEEILRALPQEGVPAVLRSLYDANSLAAMAKLLKQYLEEIWTVAEQAEVLQAEFDSSITETTQTLKDTGHQIKRLSDPNAGVDRWMDDIHNWLDTSTPYNQKNDGVAAILGTAQPGDLGLSSDWAARWLQTRGYSVYEAFKWMERNKYPIVDVVSWTAYYYGNSIDAPEVLKMAKNAGHSKEDLAICAMAVSHQSGYRFFDYLRALGFSVAEAANCYVNFGFPVLNLPSLLKEHDYYIDARLAGRIAYDAVSQTKTATRYELEFVPLRGYVVTSGHEHPEYTLQDVVRGFTRDWDVYGIVKAAEAVSAAGGQYLKEIFVPEDFPWIDREDIGDLPLAAVLDIMEDVGLRLDVAIRAVTGNKITSWEEAIFILSKAGYSSGDVLSIVYDTYRLAISFTVTNIFTAAFNFTYVSSIMNAIKLFKEFAVIGYRFADAAVTHD